jgi:hypothetical protein
MSIWLDRFVRKAFPKRPGAPAIISREPRCFVCNHVRSEHAIDARGDHRYCRACSREGAVLEERLENGQLDRLDCSHPFHPAEPLS